jgi:hypothetical protein
MMDSRPPLLDDAVFLHLEVEGKVHAVLRSEVEQNLEDGVTLTEILALAPDLPDRLRHAVAAELSDLDPTLDLDVPPAGDEDDPLELPDDDGGGDDVLQAQARILTAHRVLAAKKADGAADIYARHPGDDAARQAFVDAQTEAEEAERLAAEALGRWFTQRIRRARRARFTEIVAGRRRELELTREQLATQCGVSLSTVKNLEGSTDPDRKWNARTKAAIEQAFHWAAGSFETAIQGGDPVPLPRSVPIPASDPDPATARRAGVMELRVEPKIHAMLDRISVLEQRNINAVLEEALDLYWRIKGPRPTEGSE